MIPISPDTSVHYVGEGLRISTEMEWGVCHSLVDLGLLTVKEMNMGVICTLSVY